MTGKRSGIRAGRAYRGWGASLGRTLLALAALLALTFGLLDLADTALGSEMFVVAEVSVEGNCMLSEEEILQALDIPAVVHLWQIDTQLLEMRVMALATVRRAKVERIFPKTLSVTVEERVPLVDWQEERSGRSHLLGVDEEGVILGESSDLEQKGIQAGNAGWDREHRPILTGLAGNAWDVGERLSGERVTEVLKALSLSLAQDVNWIHRLEEIRAPRDARGWILRCAGATGDIYLGGRHFVERVGKISPTLNFLRREGIEVLYVDLRFDDQGVLIKPVNCDPDHWVEIASKYPEPDRGRDPV